MTPATATPVRTPLRALLISAGLGLALAACTASPPPEPAADDADAPASAPDPAAAAGPASTAAGPAGESPVDQPSACSVEPVQSLVGEQADEALVSRATALSGSASVRVLKPGDAATMDYRGDRLNILTDDDGIVQSFNCG